MSLAESTTNRTHEGCFEVPSYTVNSLFPKRTKYCVTVFVINEGDRIQRQLQKMKALTTSADVIIADGGSTDDSLKIEFLKSAGVRTLLTKTGGGRLSAQMRMAFAYAVEEEYQGIITIDGNDKDDPSAIPSFIKTLDKGFDHIQGSRFIQGGKAENTPVIRLLGVRFIHAPLISLAAKFKYTDTTNGFRAYSRRFLLDPRVAPFRAIFSEYELHYYLAIMAPKLGYQTTEVPVTRIYPKLEVPTKISAIRGNLSILKTLLKAVTHRFDPN